MTDIEFYFTVESLRFNETMAQRYHLKKDDFALKEARRQRKLIDEEICRRNPNMAKHLLPATTKNIKHSK